MKEFKKWFAWHPISIPTLFLNDKSTQTRRIVWLKYVMRCKRYTQHPGAPPEYMVMSFWEYKEIKEG